MPHISPKLNKNTTVGKWGDSFNVNVHIRKVYGKIRKEVNVVTLTLVCWLIICTLRQQSLIKGSKPIVCCTTILSIKEIMISCTSCWR